MENTRMKKKQPKVKSKYNSREVFSFDKVPGEFHSVTEDSIENIKKYCTKTIKETYNGDYTSRTLYAMVRTITGNFDLLTSKLKEDYSCRRSKLKKAQNSGIKQVNSLVLQFEKIVLDYEVALKLYNENVIEYGGFAIDENLHYSRERIEEFKKRLKEIEEKNHEA